MSTVIRSNGTERPVKNLGWLLAHRGDVERFTVTSHATDRFSARLLAHLSDGQIFWTDFASAGILRTFLERPSWIRVPVDWQGCLFEIGAGHGYTTDRRWCEDEIGQRLNLGDLATDQRTGRIGTVIRIIGGTATVVLVAGDFGPVERIRTEVGSRVR